jgi:hypothetical protein
MKSMTLRFWSKFLTLSLHFEICHYKVPEDTMNPYETLHQILDASPGYEPKTGPSVLLLVELGNDPSEGSVALTTAIYDPEMPERGGPAEYLALSPIQRTTLELSNVIQQIIPPMVAVAERVPLEKEAWDKVHQSKHAMCSMLRALSHKVAAAVLNGDLTPEGQQALRS